MKLRGDYQIVMTGCNNFHCAFAKRSHIQSRIEELYKRKYHLYGESNLGRSFEMLQL